MRPVTRNVLIGVCLGVVTLGYLFGTFNPLHKETNISKYPALRKDWALTGLVNHFPMTIPPQATQVRLSAFRGFLQGSPWFQLRMQLPATEVQKIEASLQGATTHIYRGGSIFEHFNKDQKNNWPTTNFHTADDPKQFAFPDDYTMYVLHAADRAHGSWNHFDSCGMAISTKRNEVVYWADR